MTSIWALAALWVGLALVATLLAIWLRISAALSEIVIGTPRRSWRNRPYVPCRCRAGPSRVPAALEGGWSGRAN